MKAMKRYIVFLPVFVWAIFFAGAEVKVENASIHRSGDSIRVSFKILVPSGTIASDYVQRLIPVIENGVDSLALDEIEIIGKRKQKLRRREAVLSGKTYEVGLNLINISIYLYLEILFNYSNIIIQSTFIGLNRDLHIF